MACETRAMEGLMATPKLQYQPVVMGLWDRGVQIGSMFHPGAGFRKNICTTCIGNKSKNEPPLEHVPDFTRISNKRLEGLEVEKNIHGVWLNDTVLLTRVI